MAGKGRHQRREEEASRRRARELERNPSSQADPHRARVPPPPSQQQPESNVTPLAARQQQPESNVTPLAARQNQNQNRRVEAVFTRLSLPNNGQLREEPIHRHFWFQTRRTDMEAQRTREENIALLEENVSLRRENRQLHAAGTSLTCRRCGVVITWQRAAASHEIPRLFFENIRLREELERTTRWLAQQGIHIVRRDTQPPPPPPPPPAAVRINGVNGLQNPAATSQNNPNVGTSQAQTGTQDQGMENGVTKEELSKGKWSDHKEQ